MRKLGVLIASLAMTIALVQPANAIHYGTFCKRHENLALDPDDWVRVCAFVNSSDASLGELIEAVGQFESGSPGPEVQFDWVHLYRGTTAVRVTGGASGWLSEGQSYSTNWWDLCQDGNGNFQSRIRYRIRWSNGAVTGYFKINSDQLNFSC